MSTLHKIAWRVVRPDFSSSHNFRWPFPGGVAEAPGPYSTGRACPTVAGDGLCLAKTPEGAASSGVVLSTVLVCSFDPRDVLGEDGIKIRVRRARVLDVWDGQAIVRRYGAQADLHRADLRGADLRGADLHGADLRGADLHRARLIGANLHGADLRGADLHRARLIGANLRGADLRGADLRGASLRGADLRGASLRGADLHGADLRGADLHGADLRGADLHGADLHGADLAGAIQ